MFIGECTETKYIGYRCITVVWDDVVSVMLWDRCVLIPVFILYDGRGSENGYLWSLCYEYRAVAFLYVPWRLPGSG